MAAFLARTYRRTVDSATSTSGISRRNRVQIRCAVCRCFRGALRSASRIASMNGIAAASFGRSRSGIFRSAGIALASAFRTSRRCTPNFRATARIVPAPCSYSRRICSYSSTLALLFSKTVLPSGPRRPKQDTRFLVYRWGQIRASKGAKSGLFRNFDATHGAGPAEAGGEYGKTRARRSSKPARPYIWRLIIFSRLIWPSTWPVLHGVSTAAATAEISLLRP